jgi:putative addiction module killer protein
MSVSTALISGRIVSAKRTWDGFPGNFCNIQEDEGCLTLRIQMDTMQDIAIFHRTSEFDAWLSDLKDKIGKARIVKRIRAAETGNFGDCEPVGKGVSEIRIHVGPGYRVYYTRSGEVVYLLLVGGDKSSQSRDIKRAIEMARALKNGAPHEKD